MGWGQTPLSMAANYGSPGVISILLSGKANIDVQDEDGNTLLMVACEKNHESSVVQLINAKCDVYLTNRWKQSAIDKAKDVMGINQNIMKMLQEESSENQILQ